MSKTASAKGRLSFAKLEYNPVSGLLKSGIPAAVDTPAPVNRHTFFFAFKASTRGANVASMIEKSFNVQLVLGKI
ncbi:Uncharacterised protein [Mycobacteroides abscessus subsp. abscessus]|nr:Uncharacterised protein [Mycobacteroides abscessus subsp. abscessus]